MKKTSLKIFITAIALGLCAYVFFRVGELETMKDERMRKDKSMTEDGFYLSEGYLPLSNWDYAGVFFLLVAFSLAFAALMIWRRNRNEE